MIHRRPVITEFELDMSHPEENNSESEPKIIVDSDWKEQVAKEKEGEVADSDGSDLGTLEASKPEEDMPPVPPASFEVLITMLFTQAMAMLGQMPDPTSGETKVNKPFAKHYIDTMEMLSEKTQGNLSDEESKILSEAIHALRMAYVNTK